MQGEATYDAAVVGGGIHGCTVALFLARGGMRVALLERGSLCREASGTNAGTLTMHMTRTALIPYALRGHRMWATARDWLGHDVGVVVCPGLSLAFTEAEAEMLCQRAERRREAGAPIDIVSPERAKQVEPGLSDKPILAAHCEIDGYASAYLTGLAYRAALIGAGAHVIEHASVTGVAREDTGFAVHRADSRTLHARRLVLTGGVWLEDMAAWLGVRLPIKILANQLAVTERLRPVMRTVLGIASGLLSLKQFQNGTVVIGGGWQGIGDRQRGGVGQPNQGGPLLMLVAAADFVDIEEIRKISHRSAESGGYLSIIQVKGPSKKCLYSRSGYRFGTTPYDNDPGLFDTVMVLHYCDPDVTLQQFSELFSNLGLVSDRDAMKFMITSTEWAGIITGGGERCTSFRIEILIDKDGGIIGEATLHRTKKRPRIVWDVSGRVDKSNSVNMRIEDIGPVGLTLAGHLTGASLSIAQPSSRSCDPPRFGVLKRLLE